ncbi:MAG: alpha/beta fold hydrolase [Caldilineaceae bacterium]
MPSVTQWLHISQPNPHARLRLFCFPYAGGAASIYRLWHQHLPAEIEVCAVQLPGRENRIREQPFTDVDGVIQALIPNLLPYLDKPFAFFGHSMGTIIAYELAQQLPQHHARMPTHLLVSGRRAPFLPDPEPQLHSYPTDEGFLKLLQQRYNNIPDLILQDEELRKLFVPLLRADFTLVETYQYRAGPRLSCPIVAYGGTEDERASKDDLMAWQTLTESTSALHRLPGGHFYLKDQANALLTIVANYLKSTPFN